MSQHEIPATFTRDQWARLAWSCHVAGNRDLLVSIFVQTGVDPAVPDQDERTALRRWWERAMR